MNSSFRFVLTLIHIHILLTIAFLPASVFAADHRLVPDGTIQSTKPPLPSYKPRISPVSTPNYHQELSFPTTTEKWIDVDLSEQRVVAYEGTTLVNSFIVSTGLPRTPTVKGTFRIRMKVSSQTMSGGSAAYGYYYLPNVQWVQYFYEGYAFHGTYWHDNFGQPMSHGCVNMRNEDAKWLFDWAGPTYDPHGAVWQRPSTTNVGTLVVAHD